MEKAPIISRRCDEAMKRSKNKARWHNWYCTGECKKCICCIEKDTNGIEQHVHIARQEDEKETTKELIAAYQEKLNEVIKELLELKQTQEAERREMALLKQEYIELSEYANKIVEEKEYELNLCHAGFKLLATHTLDLIEASWVKATNDGGRKGRYAAGILRQLADSVTMELNRICRQKKIPIEGGESEESRFTGRSEEDR